MSCYHPLKAFQIGLTENNKPKYKITSYEVDHIELLKSGNWITSIYKDRGSLAQKVVRDFVEIPCGKCIGCRLKYSQEWANRCMLELQYHDDAYFVTLTYDEDHVPLSYYTDENTGEAYKALTLYKRDLQLFFKRLRKEFSNDRIRYFCAGEYGSHTFRPHYHAIIFGLHLDDLKVYKRSDMNFIYYTSDRLQKCWIDTTDRGCMTISSLRGESTKKNKKDSVPLGFAVVAPVTWETCAYTARYTMKKATSLPNDYYLKHNILPEFSLMSRRPGIGRQWYDDHPDVTPNDKISISTEKGGTTFYSPGYFKRLYDLDFPEKSAELKQIRMRMAADAKELKLKNTSLSYLELLQVEERSKLNKIKSLKRNGVQ